MGTVGTVSYGWLGEHIQKVATIRVINKDLEHLLMRIPLINRRGTRNTAGKVTLAKAFRGSYPLSFSEYFQSSLSCFSICWNEAHEGGGGGG